MSNKGRSPKRSESVKAVGYVRVSTGEQAREGYSLAAQEQAIRAYCQAHGWELAEVYNDAGRTAKRIQGRAELNRLLNDAQGGTFERVVCWKFDRLARNLRDLLDICDRLESCNVGVVSIQESIDTGTPAGRMMRNILGSFGEFERESIQERIVAGMAEAARQGKLLGPLPLGYRRDEGGAVTTDPAIAPLIQAAFTRYASGRYSLRDMAGWAADIGLRSTGGNLLDRLSVRKLLTNPTYTGRVAYHQRSGGGFVVEGEHPAIVDVELFENVQKVLARRRFNSAPSKPFGREPYPLSGIAICGADGAPLLGVRASSGGQRYMRCSTAQRRGKDACLQPMVRAEIIEAQVAAYVSDMRLPPEYLGEVVAELRRRRRKTTTLDPDEAGRCERQLERWRRLFVLGEIDESRYRREATPLRRRLAELQRPQEALDTEKAVQYLRDVGGLWASSARPIQREFVREVFERMEVKGPQLASITPKADYAPLFVLDRAERFNGELGVVWLPGQVSGHLHYTPVTEPRNQTPLAVPALVLLDDLVAVSP